MRGKQIIYFYNKTKMYCIIKNILAQNIAPSQPNVIYKVSLTFTVTQQI